MRSATHSTAAAAHMFAKRALRAKNSVCMERAFCKNARRRSGRMRCGISLQPSRELLRNAFR
eukprot:9950160-Lingulodinium_polyedra.AAC.1